MCGIVGSVNKPFGNEILDLIHHRGPDDRGVETIVIGNNEICFGHTRLAIQDLSPAGHQPMYSHCKNYLIIFNGEIYNHLELRKKLIKNNSQLFKGHSDTETIVNYIAKFGIESIKDFNGIFALALLDIKNAKIYLARDRFGVKPIYYYFNNNEFIFSSEIKPILKLINKRDKIKIDLESLNTYLTLRYNPSPKTIFKDIYKLKPGDILEFNLKTFELKTLFNINEFLILNIKIDNEKSESYWVDALSEKLEEAVKRQMLSDVEVGSFLSGGLDSALITAIASKYSKHKIKTFCIGFEGADEENDEIEEARRSAELLGTEHYDIKIDPMTYIFNLEKSIYLNEELNGTEATLAQYEISNLASKKVKVILAGQGADEIFMGYTRYKAEMKRNKYLFLLKFLNKFKFLFIHPNSFKLRRALYSLVEKDELKRFIKIYTVFTEKEREKMLLKAYNRQINDLLYFFNLIPNNIESVSKMSILDTYTWLSDELLMYGDKMTMATSVEMRVPFLDNDLVNLVEQIPAKYKIKNGINKYILKQVAKKYLPEEIINRPKKGFNMPSLKWFQEDLNDEIKDLLLSKDSYIKQYINENYIKELINAYKLKREKDARKIFLLINLEYLLILLDKGFEIEI